MVTMRTLIDSTAVLNTQGSLSIAVHKLSCLLFMDTIIS